jgi:hypothetical protein
MCYVCAMYSVTLEASSALHNAYTTRLVYWTHVRSMQFSGSTDFVSLRIVDVL